MPRFVLLVIAALALFVRPAFAESEKTIVALLPLDAEPRLAIYGQPVAAEIAKVLAGTEVTLIVVGAKMAVPAEAELIVDGKIAHDKGTNKVELSLRIRRKADGATVGDGVDARATGLPNIDKAAVEVSQKLLVDLRKLHAERTAPALVDPPQPIRPELPSSKPPAARPTYVAITATNPAHSALRGYLKHEFVRAMNQVGRVGDEIVMPIPSAMAVKMVRASDRDLAVLLEVGDYTVSGNPVPLARARVRVRVVDHEKILFDRVVVTDSVVGDRGIAPDALAQRTAREVLAILGPHLLREVPAWR